MEEFARNGAEAVAGSLARSALPGAAPFGFTVIWELPEQPASIARATELRHNLVAFGAKLGRYGSMFDRSPSSLMTAAKRAINDGTCAVEPAGHDAIILCGLRGQKASFCLLCGIASALYEKRLCAQSPQRIFYGALAFEDETTGPASGRRRPRANAFAPLLRPVPQNARPGAHDFNQSRPLSNR